MSLTFVWEEKPISTCVNNTLEAWGGRLKWIFPEIGDLTSLRSSKNRPMTTCPFFYISLIITAFRTLSANCQHPRKIRFTVVWNERKSSLSHTKTGTCTPHNTSFSPKLNAQWNPNQVLWDLLKESRFFTQVWQIHNNFLFIFKITWTISKPSEIGFVRRSEESGIWPWSTKHEFLCDYSTSFLSNEIPKHNRSKVFSNACTHDAKV